jgi:hypothetical protein
MRWKERETAGGGCGRCGIGPDCFRRRVDYITNLAVDGRRLEEITYLSGMPAAFVTELLRESVAQGGSR